MLQNKFVVLNDKSSSIVAFVCQRHYAQVSINEIGLDDVNNINVTYVKATKTVDKIVLENKSFLKNKFDLEVTEINKKLPNVY